MNVLVISAHADDGELAAGGIMNNFINQGYIIYYVAFSIAEESVPSGFRKDIVEEECKNATHALGISPSNVMIYKYPVRRLSEYRQEILDILIEIRNRIRIDICFCPSTADVHQDHMVVCSETIRAFQKKTSIYGYDFPWNVIYTPKLNVFYEISEDDLRTKISALSCYKSQCAKENNCFTNEYIKSLAVIRGNMIGARYAEAFESIREIRRIC